LNAIDKHPDLGLSMPVVIFGYYNLDRSISFRSDRRVPTHMIMLPGSGQANQTVRQTAGRATYKGRRLLKENTGGANIKILCCKMIMI
jgi:hypothetical protein